MARLGWDWWRDAAAFCVAGVARCRIHCRFRGAGVALCLMHLRLAWHAWHLWHWAGSGGGLGLGLVGVTPRHFAWQAWDSVASTFVLRGRRGTLSHELSFCVAGVALMALGWLWWRAWAGIGRRDAAALYVAAVGLCRIHLRFAWQAWSRDLQGTLPSRNRCFF